MADFDMLGDRQRQFVRKIAARGRAHPKGKVLYACLLALIILWFEVTAFLKKYIIVFAAGTCALVLTAFFLGRIASREDRELARQQEELLELWDEVFEQAEEDAGEAKLQGTELPQPDRQALAASFISILMEENEDVVAWLTIPDTGINYPVMQTPEDENYYLYRGFYGNENKNGSLLVSAGCDLAKETTNWIIHGHNMKSGAMFGGLMKFRDRAYMQDHNRIILETAEGERTYEILSVFESKVYHENDGAFKYYQCFDIEDREQFEYFYRNIKELSLYDTGVTAVYGDRFLTLSTCAYHTENGRLVVVGREIAEE